MNRYILIAGVNGAGKSTLYQSLETLKGMERINTDEIVRSIGQWDNASDAMVAVFPVLIKYGSKNECRG